MAAFAVPKPHPELSILADKLLANSAVDFDAMMKHYDVTPAMLQEKMDSIRQWYELQPHLPQGALDDNKILRHLGVRAFSTERTKDKIDNYYSARNICQEITTNRDPMSPSIQETFETIQIITLPQSTPEGHRVSIYRFMNDDPTKCCAADVYKLAFMIADYRLENDLTLGDHFVIDMSKVKLGHVLQMTPTLVSKINYYAYTCIGAKVKGMHLVGLPSYAESLIAMVKKTLPKKVAERVYTYAKFDDLKNKFPTKILPKDMGGDEISSDEIYALWKEALCSPGWRKWFIEQDNIKTDESKRDKSKINTAIEELAGIQGSFRKLDLD